MKDRVVTIYGLKVYWNLKETFAYSRSYERALFEV